MVIPAGGSASRPSRRQAWQVAVLQRGKASASAVKSNQAPGISGSNAGLQRSPQEAQREAQEVARHPQGSAATRDGRTGSRREDGDAEGQRRTQLGWQASMPAGPMPATRRATGHGVCEEARARDVCGEAGGRSRGVVYHGAESRR
ncbi:unnamed protein product [Lampetra planeri]